MSKLCNIANRVVSNGFGFVLERFTIKWESVLMQETKYKIERFHVIILVFYELFFSIISEGTAHFYYYGFMVYMMIYQGYVMDLWFT